MSRFIEYLNEMSVEDALKFFNLSRDDFTPEKLKKRYREYSKKHHPDLGGDENEMKKVTDAYASLKKFKVTFSPNKVDWEKIDKEYRDLSVAINLHISSRFSPKRFVDYFNQLSGMSFQYKMTKQYPLKNDRSPTYAGFECEFFTADKSIVFHLHITSYLPNIKGSGQLAGGTIDFPLHVSTFIFAHNKRHKLGKSEWTSRNDHKLFTDPSVIYPKVKVKKILDGTTSRRKFSKRDMITFVQEKLGATHLGDNRFKVSLDGDLYFVIYRSVFNRVASWSFNINIYEKFKVVGKVKQYVSLPETEEVAIKLEKLYKKINSTSNVGRIVNEIEKFIQKEKMDRK